MFSWLKKKAGPPDAAAVIKRVAILNNVMAKGLATPPPVYLAEWKAKWNNDEWNKFVGEFQSQFAPRVQRLRDNGLWEDMSRSERDFMEMGPTVVENQALIDAIWLAESAMCLLWALGYISEILPYDCQAEPEITNKLPAESVQDLVKKAALRAADAIQKQRDLAELWHWRARTRQLQESGRMPSVIEGGLTIEKVLRLSATKAAENGALPAPIGDDFPAFGKAYRDLTKEEFSIATSIAMERHRALNWLCGFAPGNRWVETPTDT